MLSRTCTWSRSASIDIQTQNIDYFILISVRIWSRFCYLLTRVRIPWSVFIATLENGFFPALQCDRITFTFPICFWFPCLFCIFHLRDACTVAIIITIAKKGGGAVSPFYRYTHESTCEFEERGEERCSMDDFKCEISIDIVEKLHEIMKKYDWYSL